MLHHDSDPQGRETADAGREMSSHGSPASPRKHRWLLSFLAGAALMALLFLLLSHLRSGEEEACKQEPIVWTDPAIESAVRESRSKPQGEITRGEAEQVTILFCHNAHVTTLSDLAALPPAPGTPCQRQLDP